MLVCVILLLRYCYYCFAKNYIILYRYNVHNIIIIFIFGFPSEKKLVVESAKYYSEKKNRKKSTSNPETVRNNNNTRYTYLRWILKSVLSIKKPT